MPAACGRLSPIITEFNQISMGLLNVYATEYFHCSYSGVIRGVPSGAAAVPEFPRALEHSPTTKHPDHHQIVSTHFRPRLASRNRLVVAVPWFQARSDRHRARSFIWAWSLRNTAFLPRPPVTGQPQVSLSFKPPCHNARQSLAPSCAANRTPDSGTPARIISPSGRRPAQGKQTCFRPSCTRAHHTHHPIPRRNSTLGADPSCVLLRACPGLHCRCNRLRPPRGSSGRTGPGEAGSVLREMRPIWMMRFQGPRPVGFFLRRKCHLCSWVNRPTPDQPRTKPVWLMRWPPDKHTGPRRNNGRGARGSKNFQAIFSVTPCSCICHGILLAYQIPHRALSGVAAARLQGSAQVIPSPARTAKPWAGKQHREILPCRIIGLGNAFASNSTGRAVIGPNTRRGWHKPFKLVSWTTQCHGEPRLTIGQTLDGLPATEATGYKNRMT